MHLEAAQIISPIIGALATMLLGWIAKSASKLVMTVRELNDKMAVVVDKVNSHEMRIANLEREHTEVTSML